VGKLWAIILLLGFCSMPAMAADRPQAEVFGGYQYTRFDGGENANGWNAAATVNLNRWLGVTADFSGAYTAQDGFDFSNYTYTFGPTVSLRGAPMVTPFAHALFGGVHASASFGGVSGSTSGFATLVGGGVDVNFSHHLAFRAVQLDWMLLHSLGNTSSNNARISTGIVFKL
jgi:hypothetical protein